MPKPQDINDLRDQLLDAFQQLKEDPRRLNQAAELANVAGKVLGTLKAQMEYSVLKGMEPDIPFMGKVTGRPIDQRNARLLK